MSATLPDEIHLERGTYRADRHGGKFKTNLDGHIDWSNLPTDYLSMRDFLSKLPWVMSSDLVFVHECAHAWGQLDAARRSGSASEYKRWHDIWYKQAAKLGLTPSDRAQFVTSHTDENSEMEELLT